MKARVVIPTAAGERLSYDLALHHGGATRKSLRIVFSTTEEPFERWLFYLLRDLGAHIVSDNSAEIRAVLGLRENEPGIVTVQEIGEPDVTRHIGIS